MSYGRGYVRNWPEPICAAGSARLPARNANKSVGC